MRNGNLTIGLSEVLNNHLRSIAESANMNGMRYSYIVWESYLKREFMPETNIPGITHSWYQKYSLGPKGFRMVTGSISGLTEKGLKQYIKKIENYAYDLGIELGVEHG